MMNKEQTAKSHIQMANGDVSDKTRVVFWDEYYEHYVAVTVGYLIKHGVPFNDDSKSELEFITTQHIQ